VCVHLLTFNSSRRYSCAFSTIALTSSEICRGCGSFRSGLPLRSRLRKAWSFTMLNGRLPSAHHAAHSTLQDMSTDSVLEAKVCKHAPHLCRCQGSCAVTDGAVACALECTSDRAVGVHFKQPANLRQLSHLDSLCKACWSTTALHVPPQVACRAHIARCCVDIQLLLACREIAGEYKGFAVFSSELDYLQHRQVKEGVCDCSLGCNVAGCCQGEYMCLPRVLLSSSPSRSALVFGVLMTASGGCSGAGEGDGLVLVGLPLPSLSVSDLAFFWPGVLGELSSERVRVRLDIVVDEC